MPILKFNTHEDAQSVYSNAESGMIVNVDGDALHVPMPNLKAVTDIADGLNLSYEVITGMSNVESYYKKKLKFEDLMLVHQLREEGDPYAICTASIAKTAGTSERSKWTADDIDRWERCKADIESGK